MKLEIQKLLCENGYEKSLETFEALDLKSSIQISPKTGKKYLHIDYGIKSPKNSEIVKECRGIALVFGTWEIARYGFYRFMNSSENGADKFNKKEKITFEEKADGSIIILWHSEEEGWVAGTRGRIFNDAKMENGKSFSDYFWEIFKLNSKNNLVPGYTYIYELCSIYNRVVVFYPKPQIVLIGGRYEDFKEIQDSSLDLIASSQNVRRPERYNFKSIKDALCNAETLPSDKEGYIAKQWNPEKGRYNRVKIKGDAYKDMHMIVSSKSLNNLVRIAIRNDLNFIEYFPEYISVFKAIRAALEEHSNKCEEVWQKYKGILEEFKPEKEKRKKFAQEVLKTPYGSYCFARADGKVKTMWDEYENALEVKSRTKKYIKQLNLDKIVDETWKLEIEEED